MAKISAGILLVRVAPAVAGGYEFLLAHPGGPFFARKDDGAWTIPKGIVEPGEEPLAAARREFVEETALALPVGTLIPLGEVKQAGGKVVHVWAAVGDADADACRSNAFELEWPRGSGRMQHFPEVDRFAWFDAPTAMRKLLAAQVAFIERALQRL